MPGDGLTDGRLEALALGDGDPLEALALEGWALLETLDLEGRSSTGTSDAALLDRLAALYGAVAGAEEDGGPLVPDGDGSAVRDGRALLPATSTAPARDGRSGRGGCGLHSTVPPPIGGGVVSGADCTGRSCGGAALSNAARDAPPAAAARIVPAAILRRQGVRRWRAAVGRLILLPASRAVPG